MARLPIARFVAYGEDVAPGFDVRISGQNTTVFDQIRSLVTGVTYEEDEEMATMFELTIVNRPNTVAGKPVDWTGVVDNKAFAEGNTVDLSMGYGARRKEMGRVDLVKWLPKFPNGGDQTFTIKGFDGRHKMQLGNQHRVKQKGKKKKRKNYYRNLPDEMIVKKIAEKYGYAVDVDKTEARKKQTTTSKGKKSMVFPTRVQSSDTKDWDFLRKLADINNFDLWCDYSTKKKQYVVNFKKRKEAGNAEFLFTYNGRDGSLIEAEPDFAIQEQPTEVEVLYYDSRRRKIEQTTISDTNKAENMNLRSAAPGNFKAQKEIVKGARVRFSAFGQVIEAFSKKPFRSKRAAEQFVLGWLKERERDFLLLKGTVVGIETLRPRQIHQFEGMGKRLDGFYRLRQTTHSMQTGQPYVVSFVASKVVQHPTTERKATTKVQSRDIPQAAG